MHLVHLPLLLAASAVLAISHVVAQSIPIPPAPTTNSLAGPFLTGTGAWKLTPNGGFESGDLSGSAGYRANQPVPGMGRVDVTHDATSTGEFGATLSALKNFEGPGITLEYNSGLSLQPGRVYVVSAFLRVHKDTSRNAHIYLDLWDVAADPMIVARRDTAEWQFVWGLYDSNAASWVGLRVVMDGQVQEGDAVDIDELAITPLEDFQLPQSSDGRPLPPVVPIPVPQPPAFDPAPGLFTNSVSIVLKGGGYGAELRYSADGSLPATNSPLYKAPLNYTNQVTLKAQVFTNGIAASDVVSGTWQRVYAIDDGISAAWREKYFGPGYLTDPRVAFDADPDNDGASNLQEFTTGTDPLDPLSGFSVRIRTIPQIRWSSVVGKKYQVLHKRALAQADWDVAAEVIATAETSEFTDITASDEPGFYLVQPSPEPVPNRPGNP